VRTGIIATKAERRGRENAERERNGKTVTEGRRRKESQRERVRGKLEVHELELERQRRKDKVNQKRKDSLADRTKFYSEALKHYLPRTGGDPREYPAYFQAVENHFSQHEVPKLLQSKLLILCWD